MEKCNICPRKCNIDRTIYKGYCGMDDTLVVARAALHMWEEECISGKEGSGAVFFAGCNLRCVFCQNRNISKNGAGKTITVDRLADIFCELQKKGANNINLVTPTHYTKQIMAALDIAKDKGLNIPVVYNCGGYESVDTIKELKGYVDIFLPDFKYVDKNISKRYSNCEDYFDVAKKGLAAMYEIVGNPQFDERGMMKKGVIVRHLMLPGHVKDSKSVLKYLHETYGDNIYISIMSQYTPLVDKDKYKEIARKLYPAEYKRLVDYAIDIGIVNGFVQEGDVADESFIPEFDCEGV